MHAALVPTDQSDDFIITRATAFTNRVSRAMTREVLQGEDLRLLEWRLIYNIARFGSCHLAYITRRTSIDPAHGSRAAAALERRGLITRTVDPANRRRRLMSLTPEGEALFNRIWPRARGRVAAITDQLSDRDFADLKRLLDLVNNAAEATARASDDQQEEDSFQQGGRP